MDVGRQQKDPLLLTELVRQRIGHIICHALRAQHETLAVMTLDPTIESSLVQGLRSNEGAGVHIDPRTGERVIMKLLTMSEAMMRQNVAPVLLTSPEIRRHLKTYTRRAVPRLAVIAMTEVPITIELRSFGVIDLRDATPRQDLKEAA